jgi:retron-type reverse transcriptase
VNICQFLLDLFEAYYAARQHKRNTVNQLNFELNYEQNLLQLHEDLLSGNYTIGKSICFIVNKPVKREILAADFRDRVVHHLLFNYLNPIFEKQFIPDSYSCRAGKGTHYGVRQVAEFIRECSKNYTKDCYILKLDIRGYFMNINKELLWAQLTKMLSHASDIDFAVPKEMVLGWLKQVVFHNSIENCIIKGSRKNWKGLPPSKSLFHSPPNCGLPIGNLTSQLFSNVYLNDFDHFMNDTLQLKYYGRYVDDFVVIHPNIKCLKEVKERADNYLLQNLHLNLHPLKVYLQHCSKGVSFLGAYIKPHRIYINKRTKHNFYLAVQETEKILSAKSPSREKMEMVMAKLNSYLGIMRHYKTYNLRKKILLKSKYKFFTYGFLSGDLDKYSIEKKYLDYTKD